MRRLWFCIFALLLLNSHVFAQVETAMRPLLLTHYMPWYQTPDISGAWGWHWTMDHFDPTQLNEAGKPSIASHYMPLTDPYDSQDEAVLEYQVLLMKLSGIDGVIVDWYGTQEHNDYPAINASTNKLFTYVEKAGLSFIICYEDRTIKTRMDAKEFDTDQARAQGLADIRYLDSQFFQSETYLRYQDQPLLFTYGPFYFRTPDFWEEFFADLNTQPALVTLDGYMDWAALSSYPWMPMNMAGGTTLVPAVLDSYLNLFYRNARRRDLIVGTAFPAFHDIYSQAGVRSSYGYIDPREGQTFQDTLNAALQAKAQIIQLATWNDYGEGTIIEPTDETGYQYLETVQQTRQSLDAEFIFTPEDLRLPFQLYTLRKTHAADPAIQAQLDEAFAAIIAGDLVKAAELLKIE